MITEQHRSLTGQPPSWSLLLKYCSWTQCKFTPMTPQYMFLSVFRKLILRASRLMWHREQGRPSTNVHFENIVGWQLGKER
jgi:hypothetical protein